MAAAAVPGNTGAAFAARPVLICIRPSGPSGLGSVLEERLAAHVLAAAREARVATVAEAAAAAPGKRCSCTLDEMPDAVRALLDDDERWDEIAQAGRELCTRHTEAGAVMQVLAALDSGP